MSGYELVMPLPEAVLSTFAALMRVLMALGPEEAERGWRMSEEASRRPGEWFAVQWPGRRTYLLAGESGRFSRTAPEGVDEGSLEVIDLTGAAPTRLREHVKLLAGLVVEMEPGWRERVRRMVTAVGAVEDGGWMRGELSGIAFGLIGASSDVAFAAELDGRTRERYFHFEVPGTLVAAICLLTRIASAGGAGMLSRAMRGGGALNSFATPQVFLRGMLAKIAKVEGGVEAIAKACASLQENAEEFADKAEGVADFGRFYGAIFESVPLAYAGQQGFEFLADGGFGKAGVYRMLANVCDERVAPALATLGTAFKNEMDWRAIQGHRAAIAAAREMGGEGAAEVLADQYLSLMLLYPRFVRGFLLGETDVLPLRAAGGE